MTLCYHCGSAVPEGVDCHIVADGERRPFCCEACLAVSQCILGAGLSDYYRLRSESGRRPKLALEDFSQYDDDAVLKSFSQRDTAAGGTWESRLAVSDLHCAACAWLIEHRLKRLDGVASIHVNLQRGLATVRWDPARTKLSALLLAIAELGYPVQPWSAEVRSEQLQQQLNGLLRCLGVAGIAMMQVGMVAIGLYAGAFQDMDETTRGLLRWFGLAVTTPVIGYAAQPFFKGAWRNLRSGQLGMDVPVAIALMAAYGASAMATVRNHGEVYFDTVSMFCFFLLLSRYLQAVVQRRQEQSLRPVLPLTARQVDTDNNSRWVALTALRPGDRILVQPGELVAADGVIVSGESSIEDSAFSGEFMPRFRREGETVLAGSRNLESTLTLEICREHTESRLLLIDQLLAAAQSAKPKTALLADRISRAFVGLVLLLAVLSYGLWSLLEGHDPFLTALAVLVVSCPCALSLATPTTYTAAVNALRRRGLLVANAAALESLDALSYVVFDKTGTLTAGEPELIQASPLKGAQTVELMEIAAALEAASTHPIARAFSPPVLQRSGYPVRPLTVVNHQLHSGQGISGEINGRHYRIGGAAFCGASEDTFAAHPGDATAIYLSKNGDVVARFLIADTLRSDAPALLELLRDRGFKTVLLSGDSSLQVENLARRLGFEDFRSGCSADDKLSYIRRLQSQGHKVMMVGDGINDAPVIAAADVSVAMASASDLTRSHADVNLLTNQLSSLTSLFATGTRMQRILKQNLGWALLYNLSALPAAAMGLVPPWLAAIGMSASSVLVVLNALRLGRTAKKTHPRGKDVLPDLEFSHG